MKLIITILFLIVSCTSPIEQEQDIYYRTVNEQEMIKIETIGSSLVVTNLDTGSTLLDVPTKYVYYDLTSLKLNNIIRFVPENGASFDPVEISVDSAVDTDGVPFDTASNFYSFVRTEIGNIPKGYASQVLAFPTASGFGKRATGGRGGTVIKVTNLNDSGAGSLRAALEASGARIVVFEVGGTITLSSAIYITNGDLTIAGQTALGDGILIRGSMVQIEASNVIIRYMRFRSGVSLPNTADALGIASSSQAHLENIIIDHCSVSWADDENLDIRVINTGGSVRNVTIQNTITSECTYGQLVNAQNGDISNITFFRNLYAFNQERNIRYNYPDDATFGFEMINNFIFGCRWLCSPSLGTKFTVINNVFLESDDEPIFGACVDGTASGQGTPSETWAYVQNNKKESNALAELSSNLQPYLKTSAFKRSGILPIEPDAVEANILPTVGCSYPTRDAVDLRIISQINAGNGSIATSGTYPTINGGSALPDTNGDGIPDSWQNSNMPSGATVNDIAPSGYTWIEEYINSLV